MVWYVVVGEVDGHFEGFLLLSGCVLRVASSCARASVVSVCCLLLCHYFVGRGFTDF